MLTSPERGRTRRRRHSAEPLLLRMPPPSNNQLTRSRLAIIVTFLAWLGYTIGTVLREFVNHGSQGMRFTSEAVSYLVVVSLLTYSALVYLFCRHAALRRRTWHSPTSRAELDRTAASAPRLTVLVPSYREEATVIRQTLLSAALQEYPDLEVVLLIDDPPTPIEEQNQVILAAALAQTAAIEELLAEPADRARQALERFEVSRRQDRDATFTEGLRLIAAYDVAIEWLERFARDEPQSDHVDRFMTDHVILRLAHDLRTTAVALRRSHQSFTPLSVNRVRALHQRLVSIFTVRVRSFERKRFASLSHEPNKAMNLNSYIGLMGRSFQTVQVGSWLDLQEVTAPEGADFVVPNPDYVLTLDADSVLLPEYCLRLVNFLEDPQNNRVAVAQTPYCAFPGAPSRLERIAGATTDLQHLVHQGMSAFGAAFWVGANAVLRKTALDDIVSFEQEDGHVVRRYIKDNTVIEDTESSIDLVRQGWSLHNYPERLSFSATPPDFGSLCIQRQRWANGGLLILPKLLRLIFGRRRRRETLHLAEMFVRMNYLMSIAWATVGLVVLLAYPYNDRLLSPLVFVSALPYFMAMASDLRSFGYRRRDVLSLYGFNLVLLPVNFAGLLGSLRQAVNGRKTPFARTPKVKDRTTAPLSFVVCAYVVVGFSAASLVRDIQQGHVAHAIYSGMNAVLCTWGIVAFIGLRASLVDIWMNVRERLYRPERVPVRARERSRRVLPLVVLEVGAHVLGEYVPVDADVVNLARPTSGSGVSA